jgi:hypothetical protein
MATPQDSWVFADWAAVIAHYQKDVPLLLDEIKKRVREVSEWKDVDDEWTDAIKAAHPARSGAHDEYATAMKMVGHRHSKGELVALVTWLLARLKAEEQA